MKSEILLEDLTAMTKDILSRAERFSVLSEADLNFKLNDDSWSVLECLEHLNRYGDFYIPEIDKCIKASQNPTDKEFKSGVLGNYFAKSMLPREALNKMKTFKSMNPAGSKLDTDVLDKFIRQQHALLDLVERARAVSLTKNKTGISISRWIKLRLGDTFRVVIYHNLRHIVQAERVLSEVAG